MSRSNKNNRKKIRFTENGNEQALRCSSSSSSSNYSDDADALRNAVIESLMKNVAAATKSKTLSTSAASADSDDDRPRRPVTVRPSVVGADDEKQRTDVKIVRIKTLDSDESKLLLIVDVLDRNPFRIEVNGTAKRRDERDDKCIKVDMEALKRGECPKEIRNLCAKVRSRRIYKLPDDLMRKFDQKGVKVFEWHSFNRPDDAIRLLLDDGAASTTNAAAAIPCKGESRKKMIIGFRKRSAPHDDDDQPDTASSTVKIRRTVSGGEARLVSRGIRKARMAAEQRNRNRALHKLLKEYNMSGVWDVNNQTQINRLVRSHLDLRAKEATERTCINRRKELNDVSAVTTMAAAVAAAAAATDTRETKWSVSRENFALQRNNLDAVDVLQNDDNVASVGSNGADVNAIDGSSDALDSSNNDDNDSKAKKKNRCALCRKKVGLTGFECRCGGLYCGIHRYSDKHNCTFDYRQLGAQEIRRNNPVVIGEKIQKI